MDSEAQTNAVTAGDYCVFCVYLCEMSLSWSIDLVFACLKLYVVIRLKFQFDNGDKMDIIFTYFTNKQSLLYILEV